ncbi:MULTISPECIES: succinylglutamate desuccinylase/aspartoacylase family protein [unclassified Haladaptatus]|uniref:succinylglutamate desuccinylase/aspartoacylase domain-containing protein n=1 Tax=unclassified Haladaptatus TaxID=2622732 RepID=UPI00209C34AA|nr:MULTISPECIES: succinylglutamate desuccinylase/aspartoacylase family protein [unclassified Haladaptatus]MCO8245170.1 succinylglutamate desuccinylase/aspartoacylase family protein [Haladaptatus sp. AB643]MCO8253314.1 succinylglutamate desuccinylase/aspartoacylase family protein [Haladaptatus sp. AB618]
MRIEQLGEGTPEVAIVAGIHGDEPCGPRAVERLLTENPDVERAVKVVVANERALERGVRYINEDLNRVFPGDPDAETYEQRLAHELVTELRDCTVLSLHSTQSYAQPFALVDRVNAVARSICPYLPVSELVETDVFTKGKLISHPHTLEVECGLQGSDEAARNAYDLVRGFLAGTGALPLPEGENPVNAGTRDEVEVFRMDQPVLKNGGSEFEVLVDNFQRVGEGEAFATSDGAELVADEPFVPVLMSAYGYEDIFGYTAEYVGALGN